MFNFNQLPDEILTNIFSFLLVPQKIQELKMVSRRWKAIITALLNATPFLSLDNTLQRLPNKPIMAMAPLVTSGDIYHMLSLEILSLKFRKQLPPILLTYDNEGTKLHVDRSVNFIFSLGLHGGFLRPFQLPLNAPYADQRQNTLENILSCRDQAICKGITHYIDHRMATSIIAEQIRLYGFAMITSLIRDGFRARNIDDLTEENSQIITRYVDSKYKDLRAVLKRNKNKPMVIIHQRISDDMNASQNISTEIGAIIRFFKANYTMVVVYADDATTRHNEANIHYSISPFQDFTLPKVKIEQCTKAHLRYVQCRQKNIYLEYVTDVKKWFIAGYTLQKQDTYGFKGYVDDLIGVKDFPDIHSIDHELELAAREFTEGHAANITSELQNVITDKVRILFGFPFHQQRREDMAKLVHLELFLRLYDRRNEIQLLGIIGNTSGTLDLLSLIGHNVFNIHNFKAKPIFDYQDYRMFLQTSFLAVEREDNVKLLENIVPWLQAARENKRLQPRQEICLVPPNFSDGVGRGLDKRGFVFFSSVQHVQLHSRNNWLSQGFFSELNRATVQKCCEAFLLNRPFQPPLLMLPPPLPVIAAKPAAKPTLPRPPQEPLENEFAIKLDLNKL